MNVDEKSNMKTADKNNKLKIIVREDKKEKKSFFTVIIIKH